MAGDDAGPDAHGDGPDMKLTNRLGRSLADLRGRAVPRQRRRPRRERDQPAAPSRQADARSADQRADGGADATDDRPTEPTAEPTDDASRPSRPADATAEPTADATAEPTRRPSRRPPPSDGTADDHGGRDDGGETPTRRPSPTDRTTTATTRRLGRLGPG